MTVARNHDYGSDLAIWNDAVDQRPHNVRAVVNLGTVHAKLARTDEAITRCEGALRVDPHNPDEKFHLGVTLANRNESAALIHLTDAEREYSEGLRLRSSYADARANLGSALAQLG